ncbi:MAG: hypothetical protein HC881_14595 [Leptolyngbyaceae cyanobacterium SL_7_1]|nr:hypothetical protein [Leptolyngbyaceae cyanobacterium SL_7_1]
MAKDHHYDKVLLLLDQKATLSHLRRLLHTYLPETLGTNARLLFYFAGHGIALNNDDGPCGFLIPQDAKLGDTSTYLPMTELHDALIKLGQPDGQGMRPCRHFLGILDCCFAGAFRWSSVRDIGVPPEEMHRERYDRYLKDPAWQVITSASYDQTALDALTLKDDRGQTSSNHSPFAATLFEALQGGADLYPPAKDGRPAGDGVTTATELYFYIREQVEIATATHAKRQTPGLHPLKNHDKGEYMFLTPGHVLNLPDAPPLNEALNPYRGLESYGEEHKDLFFGRDKLTRALSQFVTTHPLTIVLGTSGSGKSSLVKAGLIPQLKDPDRPDRWHILQPMRPGVSPFMSLNILLGQEQLSAIALPSKLHLAATPPRPTNSLPLTPQAISEQDYANFVQLAQDKFAAAVQELIDRHPQQKLLLVIDQAEEIITLCQHPKEREAFLEVLAAVHRLYFQRLHIVLTLRSDFEPMLRNLALEPGWTQARFIVPAMMREELREAIERPASARVIYFEPYNLVDRLIDEVAQMPGALPLLSFTLSELFLTYLRSQRHNRAITEQDYEAVGGVMRSLTQRADQEYNTLIQDDPACEYTVKHVMLRMVATGGGELARRSVPLSELMFPEPEHHRVAQVRHHFSQARLLVEGQDSEGNSYVEPAHDALVRGWQRLLNWKKEEQEKLLLQRQLTPQAEDWQRVRSTLQQFLTQKTLRRWHPLQLWGHWQRQAQYLWHNNPRLALLKQELRSPRTWFNQVESEFVRRSVRRKRFEGVVRSGLVTAVMVGLGGLLLSSIEQGERSLLAEYAADAQNTLTIDPVTGLLRTIELANRNQHGTLRYLPLHRGFQWFPPQELLNSVSVSLGEAIDVAKEKNYMEGHAGYVYAVAFSPDEAYVVSGGSDRTLRLWTWDGEAVGQPWQGHTDTVNSVAVSPDGSYVVSGSSDQTVRVWDWQGNSIAELTQHTGAVLSVAVHPDAQQPWIASGSTDGTVRLWNWQTGEVRVLQGHTDEVYAVAFDAAGTLIGSGGEDATLRLWNLEGTPVGAPIATSSAVLSIAFHPAQELIVTGNNDSTVNLWSYEQLIREIQGHSDWVRSVAISPDGRTILSGSDDRTIRAWDLQGNPVGLPMQGHEDWVQSVAFSPSGNTIASGSDDGSVRLWDWDDEQFYTYNLSNYDKDDTTDLAFSNYGYMAASLSDDGTVKLWRWRQDTSNYGTAIPIELQLAEEEVMLAFALHPSEALIVSGNQEGELRLWNLQGEPIGQPLQAHPPEFGVHSIAFNSTGDRMTSISADGTTQMWQLDDSNGDGSDSIATVADTQLSSIASSLMEVEPGDRLSAVQFTPDDQTILLGSMEGRVYTWNWQGAGWELTPPLKAHSAEITAIASDGNLIYTGSADRTIRLWNWHGESIGRIYQGHQNNIRSINLSYDFDTNGEFYSLGFDGQVRTWQTRTQIQVSDACERLSNHWIFKNRLNDPLVHQVTQICSRFNTSDGS